jgi:hypothetical protein
MRMDKKRLDHAKVILRKVDIVKDIMSSEYNKLQLKIVEWFRQSPRSEKLQKE